MYHQYYSALMAIKIWHYGIAFSAIMQACVLMNRRIHKTRNTVLARDAINWTLWSVCFSFVATIAVIHHFKMTNRMDNNYYFGPIRYGFDFIAYYSCALLMYTFFSISRKLPIPRDFATVPLPLLLSLTTFTLPHANRTCALAVTGACVVCLVITKELKRPRGLAPAIACATLAAMGILGIASTTFQYSAEDYFQQAEKLGYERQMMDGICFCILSDERDDGRRWMHVALSYTDWDLDVAGKLKKQLGDPSSMHYNDISVVEILEPKGSDRLFTQGSAERYLLGYAA